MNKPRVFRLKNGNNEIYDFMSTEHFLHDVSGLGLERNYNYMQVRNGFIRINSRPTQGAITGTISFTPPDNYIKYDEFMDFASIEPLVFMYLPVDRWDYYQQRGVLPSETTILCRDVAINKVQKGELNKSGSLEVGISFLPESAWYEHNDIIKYAKYYENGSYNDFAFHVTRNELNYNGVLNPTDAKVPFRYTIYGPIKITPYVDAGYLTGYAKIVSIINSISPYSGDITIYAPNGLILNDGDKLVYDTINNPIAVTLFRENGEIQQIFLRRESNDSKYLGHSFDYITIGSGNVVATDEQVSAGVGYLKIEVEERIYHENL